MKGSYVNYKTRRGPLGQTYYEAVEEGIHKFINNEENMYRKISKDESRNYGIDIEASYLCHGIWAKLMKSTKNNGNPYTKNYLIWNNGSKKSDLIFHFDIMNNPKSKSCGLAKMYLDNNTEKNEWKEIYHSVGNMVPIPWFEVDGNHFIDGQGLHKSLDERWDLYLQLLKDNWKVWGKDISITFEEYMKLTCQQMYYKEIFEDISKGKIEDINIEDINNWNNKIQENSPLISFSLKKYDNIDSIVEDIIKLIKIRCRVIYLLLSEKKE